MCGRRGFVRKAKDHKEIGKKPGAGTAVGAVVSEPDLTKRSKYIVIATCCGFTILYGLLVLVSVVTNGYESMLREAIILFTSGLRSGNWSRIHIDIMDGRLRDLPPPTPKLGLRQSSRERSV